MVQEEEALAGCPSFLWFIAVLYGSGWAWNHSLKSLLCREIQTAEVDGPFSIIIVSSIVGATMTYCCPHEGLMIMKAVSRLFQHRHFWPQKSWPTLSKLVNDQHFLSKLVKKWSKKSWPTFLDQTWPTFKCHDTDVELQRSKTLTVDECNCHI